MAVGATVGESQLQRIIRDLHEAVGELAKEYKENGEPITDDSTSLHKFSYKLEYLLQFDQKEKTTFLGTKKDYWDYFTDCLAKIKGANDGIRFVKSISELKTSLGKGRAFIRYSLVHQRLADTLQQCLINQRVTSDWYYARSPFLKPHLSVDIINHLYELNEIHFDVASRGYDLDASWPTFARRTLGGAGSPGHTWKPPSRSSSVNSLASSYSQQASEFLSSPDYGHGLLNDLNDSLAPCNEDASTVEDLRLELDRSDLKQQELLNKVQQLSGEAEELRGVVVALQRQLDISLSAQEEQRDLQGELKDLQRREETLSKEVEKLKNVEKVMEAEHHLLQEKLAGTEGKNIELLAKLDGILSEKGQQAASHFDSAQKIHELLDSLKEAEKGKMEAIAEAEEKRRQTERTEEALRVKEAAVKDAETKLSTLLTSASEEKGWLQTKVDEQSQTLEMLEGTLTLSKKETSNLQKQLQELQTSLEEKEKEAENVKRRAQEDRGELLKSFDSQKDTLEGEICALKEQWKIKEAQMTSRCEKLQDLEDLNQKLSTERDKLTSKLNNLESYVREQDGKIEDYKTQCANLMELNEKLLTSGKRNEEIKQEMVEHRTVLEGELASLRASEKQLRRQMDDAKMTVGEKEKGLREENVKLEENLERATMAAKLLDVTSKQLEKENQSLREEQDTVKESLVRMQTKLKSAHGQIEELEKSLRDSRKSEASLQEQLRAMEAQLQSKEKHLVEVESRLIALEARDKELELAKAKVETAFAKQTEIIEMVTSEKQAMEKCQLERSAVQAKENQEVAVKLTVMEGQLDVSMKEMSRLQADILDLKVNIQRSEEEKLKSQAQLEVTEAQRDELRTLTEQLKVQTEALNQKHVAELLECKKKEEALTEQRDREMAAHAELSISAAAHREEMSALKAENNRLTVENTEIREGLHRANTEMAELGMTICKLSAEKEEARKHWVDDAAAIEELRNEVERLEDSMGQLQLENERLEGELYHKEKLPDAITKLQEELEKSRSQVQNIRVSSQEEMEALRFQMSSENMNHQVQLKNVDKQLMEVKSQLQEEKKTVSCLQDRVSELEAENEQYLHLSGEKDAHITKTEATVRKSDSAIQQLRDTLTSAENTYLAVQNECEELKRKLSAAEVAKESEHLKMTAEIDDLNRTKVNLEERLIELIRDKDALWQKSDALEFEQKLRAEERWWLVDKDTTHCLGCQGQFTWWLRRHHCRLCGRIFCYYCSNNYVMTKHSGKKERCCRDCFSQHSAVVERFTAAELSPSDLEPSPPGAGPHPTPEPAPYKPTPSVRVSEPSDKPDDGTFDIITEEEVNGVYDSDSNSQTTGGSLEGEQEPRPHGSLDIGVGELNPDEPEENVATVQDSEINLLKSGELTMAIPLNIEDISQFGDGSRELFIKSSCYSVVTVAVDDPGPTIGWMFSSEPKSISFSVVFKESAEVQVEQSKVLIPLTRCNSHKETIQGQLKVRRPGTYALIFDNSFSRFISKKVFYHLTMEKPIIYDGSDFP
ncbi:FYVE and coiled-coil domain-containing protein 1 isoform X2 [Syngnathoides biaculeatus]|nr:FYVE and coiled-coil domain-containing protein 1 isoform X2 [Syngnathoides biaculeatus]XP_061680530.1 FYVE and coiled-coil domain-containing protein 1 isoform X2 [Syngnathoides biaculeatus]XP_061680531.1 FYVE and coiled-coil domain-containing protein 1 isoform X2 [Syngnathoides biaculeatus]XP_061680532.1 FYVE and coiled-coil domain-containing protein 1 isoform X2 [Syngnathoides biaculeatus]XP_061680533.1 FYVE and coiled-coil domain-containing protein 1 isoform X2 [Syngnathoides biaculeatus]